MQLGMATRATFYFHKKQEKQGGTGTTERFDVRQANYHTRLRYRLLITNVLGFGISLLSCMNQMVTTVSRMLLEEREKEEAALKVIVDKQASAPSWWPTCRAAAGGGTHYERIRRAERIIARAESQVIKGKELLAKNQEATTNINIATSSAICDT